MHFYARFREESWRGGTRALVTVSAIDGGAYGEQYMATPRSAPPSAQAAKAIRGVKPP